LLARRHDACRYGHDSAVSIHPGIVHTHLATGFFQQTGHNALPFMKALVAPMLNCLYPLLMRTPESSAEAMLIAATAPAGKVAGRYMHNDRLSRPDKVNARANLLLVTLLGRVPDVLATGLGTTGGVLCWTMWRENGSLHHTRTSCSTAWA
jgi:hypothetical protein